MLHGKKIVVTGGGTQEFIDDVRVLTNISTGSTACEIVYHLAEGGARVTFIHGMTSEQPHEFVASRIPVRTAKDALNALEKICVEEKPDAVIHCMAVSDFTFKRDNAIKLKSNDPQAFIDYLRDNIIMNPKIISHIKEWAPSTILIGFKFEVGITTEQLLSLARGSIDRNKCALVVANDKVLMEQAKTHVAHFVYAGEMKEKFGMTDVDVSGNPMIASEIVNFLEKALA